ncbi:hypothetical protein BLA29_005072, partial [Euroglyphus maynei]
DRYIDSIAQATKVPVHVDHYNHCQANYDNLCYPPPSALYMNSRANYMPPPPAQPSDNTYLNFPFNVSRTLDNQPMGYDHHQVNNGQPSPLPPPPPLPTYSSRSNNATPNTIIQPIAQQARQSSGIYLDLSTNRENRGSAFELYQRKPLETSSARISTTPGSPMFLPPPPPPLLPVVNDFK